MSETNVPAPRSASWFDAEDAPARADVDTCIHCGLCLTACPTYRELKIEPDSPRGRLYLMRGLAEGRITPTDPLVRHLDQCLDCRACETVCPAGVPYSRLLEQTRGQLNRRAVRATPLRMLGEWALTQLLPHRGRLQFAADVLRLSQQPPWGSLARALARFGMLPRFAARGLAMTPALAPRRERALERVAPSLPPGARMAATADAIVFHPAGAPKGRVTFHHSCVMPVMFPELDREAVRLLVLAGVEVVVPRAQTCCGALQAHAGLRRAARDLARANTLAFPSDVDFVVSHSAGCGAALRETGHLLHDGPDAEIARAFGERVRDVSEVLAHFGLPPAARALHAPNDAAAPLRVAYHDACHLAHAQRVREAPRRLLRQLPGVALSDVPRSDWCCGSAGVYNLTHPEMADAQLDRKLDSIEEVAPHVVIASNPGCLLHMRRGSAERGDAVRFAHLVELLGEAHPAPSA